MSKSELVSHLGSPSLCLKCGNFPCTCGEQYAIISDKLLLLLISRLSKIIMKRQKYHNIQTTVDNVPIENVILGVNDSRSFRFTSLELENIPSVWVEFLTTFHNNNAYYDDLVRTLCSDIGTNPPARAPLLLAILIILNINYLDIIKLIQTMFFSDDSNVVLSSIGEKLDVGQPDKHKNKSVTNLYSFGLSIAKNVENDDLNIAASISIASDLISAVNTGNSIGAAMYLAKLMLLHALGEDVSDFEWPMNAMDMASISDIDTMFIHAVNPDVHMGLVIPKVRV